MLDDINERVTLLAIYKKEVKKLESREEDSFFSSIFGKSDDKEDSQTAKVEEKKPLLSQQLKEKSKADTHLGDPYSNFNYDEDVIVNSGGKSSFWDFFSFGGEQDDNKTKDKVTKIEDSEKRSFAEERIVEPLDGFLGVIELNRVEDDTILNFQRDRSLALEPLYGIDEIEPKSHSDLYLQPNINLLYSLPLVSFAIDFRLNINQRNYLSGDNFNYYLITPTLSLISLDRELSIDLIYSSIDVEGDSASVVGVGSWFKLLNIDWRLLYKLNTLPVAELNRDTLSFSGEKSFQFDESQMRLKYRLNINSLTEESKREYILVQDRDENSSSSPYPSKYISHNFGVNYLTQLYESTDSESGLWFEYRSFDVERTDIKWYLFTNLEYQLFESQKIGLIVKYGSNSSDEDDMSYSEFVAGLNYLYHF